MPLGDEFAFLAIFFGISIGTIASMVGVGGGILLMPTCIFILGFSIKDSIVISLFFMTGTVISGSIRYMKLKLVNYRLALLYSIWDVPGVIIGGLITLIVTNNILAGLCGSLIIILSILLFKRKEIGISTKHISKNNESITVLPENSNYTLESTSTIKGKKIFMKMFAFASLSSFSGGFISGLAGLGGGTVDTTSMIFLGLEPKKAAATGELGNIVSPLSGIIVHLLFGSYTSSWLWLIFVTLGGIIGAQIGVHLTSRVKGHIIKTILAGLALYTGILMILLMFGIGWIQ
jgi:uncharacterized membrane protein YfcA